MKRIILFLVLLASAYTASAQFPNIDSLRKFNNRYIKSSAIDAFTNLRLNTVLNGLINFTDSAYNASPADKLDSVVLKNDTVLTSYKAGAVVRRDTLSITGGTTDTTSLSTRINTKVDSIYASNDSTLILVKGGIIMPRRY